MPILARYESDLRDGNFPLDPTTIDAPSAYVDEYNGLVAAVRYARWRQYGEIFLIDRELLPDPIYTTPLTKVLNSTERHAVLLPFFKFKYPMKTPSGEPGHLVLQNFVGAEEVDASLNYLR